MWSTSLGWWHVCWGGDSLVCQVENTVRDGGARLALPALSEADRILKGITAGYRRYFLLFIGLKPRADSIFTSITLVCPGWYLREARFTTLVMSFPCCAGGAKNLPNVIYLSDMRLVQNNKRSNLERVKDNWRWNLKDFPQSFAGSAGGIALLYRVTEKVDREDRYHWSMLFRSPLYLTRYYFTLA